jgi:hypothetical protein
MRLLSEFTMMRFIDSFPPDAEEQWLDKDVSASALS